MAKKNTDDDVEFAPEANPAEKRPVKELQGNQQEFSLRKGEMALLLEFVEECVTRLEDDDLTARWREFRDEPTLCKDLQFS